jgi:hypothetical protein
MFYDAEVKQQYGTGLKPAPTTKTIMHIKKVSQVTNPQ